jgi:hypothetical protein
MEILIKPKPRKEILEEFKIHLKNSKIVKKDIAMNQIKYAISLTNCGVSLDF